LKLPNLSDFPFAPRRWPFSYGWVIAFVSMVGSVMSAPGQTMGVSVFTEHLCAALRVDRLDLSAAYMYGTIASSLVLPFAGRLLDRFGARIVVVCSTLGLGATLIYLSRSDVIADALRRAMGTRLDAVGPVLVVMTVGFFLVRFWGQGVLTMVSKAMLGKWFHVRRGFVMGITGALASAIFSISPAFFAWLIGSGGDWRGAWMSLALIVGIGMTALGGLFFRDNPEECGLRMDGAREDVSMGEGADTSTAPLEKDFTLREACRTYAFWIFNVALMLPALIMTAMTFHIVDFGRLSAISEREVYALFPSMALYSILINVMGGRISDGMRIRYLLWAMLAGLMLGSAGLLQLHSPVGRAMFSVGYGVSGGLFNLISGVVWPRFYGRAHLGVITGVHTSIVVFGSAIGPWLFAFAKSSTGGGYEHAVVGGIIVSSICLFVALDVENPQRVLRRETPSSD